MSKLRCDVCGKEYECKTCKDFKTIDSWRLHADTPNCFKIYTISSKHTKKIISTEKAKSMLLQCDLSEIDTFPEYVRGYLNEILNS